MTPQDGALIILLFVANFWQMSKSTQEQVIAIYKEKKHHLSLSPSADNHFAQLFFSIIWTILYSLKMLSGYFLMYSGANIINTAGTTSQYFAGAIAMYVLTVYLDKQWSVWFFDYKNPYVSLVIVVLLLIASAIYLWLVSAYNGVLEAFGLYCPLLAWYVIAMAWNVQWIYGNGKEEKVKMDEPTNTRISGKIPLMRTPKPPAFVNFKKSYSIDL